MTQTHTITNLRRALMHGGSRPALAGLIAGHKGEVVDGLWPVYPGQARPADADTVTGSTRG